LASKDSSSNAAERMPDPYQAYYRYARRRQRIEVAVVIGVFFLALILVSAGIIFWHTESDQRLASVDKENVTLGN